MKPPQDRFFTYLDIGKCKKGDKNCNILSKALNTGSIDILKYVCNLLEINYLEYLYGNCKYSDAIYRAKHFKDLEGAIYVLAKFNRTYPEDLYSNNFNQENLDLAQRLLDLRQIKKMYEQIGANYTKFYLDLEMSNELLLYFAIKNGDLDGVKYILDTFHILSREYFFAIQYSYYREELEVASYIIKHSNRSLDVKLLERSIVLGLMRSDPKLTYVKYQEHLNAIEQYLTPKVHRVTRSVVHSMFCTGKPHALSSRSLSIYSDSFHQSLEFQSISEMPLMVQDTLVFNLISPFKVDLFVPLTYMYSFFISANVDDRYKKNIIYIGEPELSLPVVYHEQCHAMLHSVFSNEGLPYSINAKFDQLSEYETAVNQTLANVIRQATGNLVSSYTVGFGSILLLNYWYLVAREHPDITRELCKSYNCSSFNVKQQQKVLEKIYNKMSKQYNWTENFGYILYRMHDYFERDDIKKPQEFFPIITELFARGMNAQEEQFFEPALVFWQKYISPVISEQVDLHYSFCINSLDDEQSLDDCAVFALPSDLQNQLLLDAAEKNCIKCVQEICSDSRVNITVPTKEKLCGGGSSNPGSNEPILMLHQDKFCFGKDFAYQLNNSSKCLPVHFDNSTQAGKLLNGFIYLNDSGCFTTQTQSESLSAPTLNLSCEDVLGFIGVSIIVIAQIYAFTLGRGVGNDGDYMN